MKFLRQKLLIRWDLRIKTTKESKKRVTLQLCTNMSGRIKMKPLMVGHSAKPRCFRGIKSLWVDCFPNKSTWMTARIFEEFLKKMNNAQEKKSKRCCLLIDNAYVHKISNPGKFPFIKISFLPPDTISATQPLDAGIIRSMECFYKKFRPRPLIEKFERKNPRKLDLLEVTNPISDA